MAVALFCRGGYPCPEAQGRMEITGIAAVPTTAATAMVVELRDIWDADEVNDPQNDKRVMIQFKSDGNLSMYQAFDPPIKTINGIRAKTLTNTAGVTVYIR